MSSGAPPKERFSAPGFSGGQIAVMATLLVGYASFYLCRANADAVLPLLHDAYGYDKTKLGVLTSTATAVYAIGKVIMGALGDKIGGRRLMLVAVAGSIVATVCFGLSNGFFLFLVFASASRFFQSGGWSSVVHVVSRWFPPGRHGTVMGALSTSYEIGNVCAILLCGFLIEHHFGWRALYRVNPVLFALFGVMLFFLLRGEPPVVESPDTKKEAATESDDEKKLTLREALPFLLKNPAFWSALALSVLLTFVRHGFLTWTPTYLTEVARANGEANAISTSIVKSAIFPATGVIATVVVGRISDHFGPGKRAPVLVVSMLFHVVAVLFLAHGGLHGTTEAMLAIGACGLFLLGPYSLMAGAIALDLAGKRAAATAVGLIDGAGYLGASLVGIVLGGVADRWGWTASFDVVAVAGFLAMIVGIGASWSNRTKKEALRN